MNRQWLDHNFTLFDGPTMRFLLNRLLLALFSFAASGTLVCGSASADSLPVFPGAKGFGTTTVAGSGRRNSPPLTTVYRVTNLNASGGGSLRACVEASGDRICVFEVSGTIRLASELAVRNPYITIAGHTAPSPGILLRGATLVIYTHDVLIQHLQVRVGDDPSGPNPETRDGISIYGSTAAFNVVIDHVSVSWAIDENFSTWFSNTHDVTLSHSIIAEGLDESIHPKGRHSKGALIGPSTERISVHHTLFAHNVERNPYVKPGCRVEFINNVVYHWGDRGGWNLFDVSDYDGEGLPVLLNFRGNYYKAGPGSVRVAPIYGGPAVAATRVFADGNIGPTRPTNSGSQWLVSSLPENPHRSPSPPFSPSGVEALPPDQTYDRVLRESGARAGERGAVDTRIISEVMTGTGAMKDCVSGCTDNAGGWPVLAENRRSLILPQDPHGDQDHDGYTNLEEWLHTFATQVQRGDHEPPAAPVLLDASILD